MGESIARSTEIAYFVTARTEADLVRAMLLNNQKFQAFIHYFDIQQKKDGSWIAFFYTDISKLIELGIIKDGNSQK